MNRVAAVLALLCLAETATAQTAEDNRARCKGSRDTDPGLTIAACTALIEAGPHSDASLSVLFMNRGLAYAKTERRQLALNDWVRALSLDRTNSLIYYNRGLMFLDENELDSALRDAERGLAVQPQGSFRYHLIHAEVLRRRGQFADAAIRFEKMFSFPLDDAQQAADIRGFQTANEQAKRCGDADAGVSIAACTAVINDKAMTPEAVANAYNTRAVAHGRNDNWEQAVRDHDESIRLNSSSAVFFANRGIASIRLENYGQAALNFHQSLSLDPKGLAPINGQGLLARQLMDYAGAIERFTAAIAHTPEPAPDAIAIFLANRGMTYLLMEKYDEALLDLNRALSITPRSAFTLFSRGVLRIRKGDVAGGEADIAAAKAVQSDIEVFMARRHLRR